MAPARVVVAALRWLWLLTVTAPAFILADHFTTSKQSASYEVPWHKPLLLIYQVSCLMCGGVDQSATKLSWRILEQFGHCPDHSHVPLHCVVQAAASGQPDIAFAEENKSRQDKAREDLRGLVRNTPEAPQEVKRVYALAGGDDPSGIQKNKPGFAKASKAASCQFIITSLPVRQWQQMRRVWAGLAHT